MAVRDGTGEGLRDPWSATQRACFLVLGEGSHLGRARGVVAASTELRELSP